MGIRYYKPEKKRRRGAAVSDFAESTDLTIYFEVRLVTPTAWDNKSYRSFSEKLEKLVEQVSKVHKLKLGTPSANCQTDITIDSCHLIGKNEADVDLVADKLAAKLSSWSVRDGVTIVLSKHNGDKKPRESFIRRVLPKADPRWIDFKTFLRTTKHGNDTVKDWPVRIQYLAQIASRYYAWGGNDVVSVFPDAKELHEFVEGLGAKKKAELLTIAKVVAKNEDHLFIMDWYMEEGVELDWPRFKAMYFLALLERLREEGIIKANPKIKGYIDWNKMGG